MKKVHTSRNKFSFIILKNYTGFEVELLMGIMQIDNLNQSYMVKIN